MSAEEKVISKNEIAQATPLKPHELKPSKTGEGTVPKVEKPTGAMESDIRLGGNAERPVTIEEDAKNALISNLTGYTDILRTRQQNGEILKKPEQLILESELVKKLQAGSLTGEEFFLCQSALERQIFEQEANSGLIARDTPAETQRTEGRFKKKALPDIAPGTSIENADVTTRYTSEQLRLSGFDKASLERKAQILSETNNLRLRLLEASFDGGYSNPLFESLHSEGFPRGNERASDNKYSIARQNQIENVLKEQGLEGKSLRELYLDDPTKAVEIYFDADHRAIMDVARDKGREILQSKSPTAFGTTIEDRATELSKPPKPDDRETVLKPFKDEDKRLNDEIEILQQSLTKTDSSISTLGTEVADLKAIAEARRTEYDKVLQAIIEADKAAREMQLRYDRVNDTFNDERDALDNQINDLTAIINEPRPAGLTGKDANAFDANKTKVIAERTKLVADLATLKKNLVDAEVANENAQFELKELNKSRYPTEIKANTEEFNYDAKKSELDRAKVEKARLEAEIKAKNDEKMTNEEKQQKATVGLDKPKEVTAENQEMAKALRAWGSLTGDKYTQIIEARYSQTREGDYSRVKLASIVEKGGQLEGAEAIREHLFKLVDPINYDPALARKMLSDETIARALIHELQLDPKTEVNVPPFATDTYKSILDRITTKKGELTSLRRVGDINTKNAEIRAEEQRLLKEILPLLKNKSEFEIGDTLRFLINEGQKASANNGNPFLDLSNDTQYLNEDIQKVELPQTAESIRTQDIGEASVSKKGVEWNVVIHPNWANSRSSGTDMPLNARIVTEFGRDGVDKGYVDYSTAVQLNQRLFESLPETVDPALPEVIRRYCYDRSGTLRQELSNVEKFVQLFNSGVDNGTLVKGTLDWLIIDKGRVVDNPLTTGSSGNERAGAKLLDAMPSFINPIPGEEDIEARNNMEMSLAEKILTMDAAQRKEIITGTSSRIMVSGVPIAGLGTTQDLELDIDNNGDILIGDVGGSPKKLLKDHFTERAVALQKQLGTTTLDAAAANELWLEQSQIMQTLGREVFLGLGRRQ